MLVFLFFVYVFLFVYVIMSFIVSFPCPTHMLLTLSNRVVSSTIYDKQDAIVTSKLRAPLFLVEMYLALFHVSYIFHNIIHLQDYFIQHNAFGH